MHCYWLLLLICSKYFSCGDDFSYYVECSNETFLDNNGKCHPYFRCSNGSLIDIASELQGGYVKRLFLANWKDMALVFSEPRYSYTKEDFLHGVQMLKSFQHTRFVAEMVGYCVEDGHVYLATKYYENGSAEKLTGILGSLNLSRESEFRTRLNLALDYLSIIDFLHNSPIGTRVMCDSNDLEKTLSQYLITDRMHLVVADLDALPEVISAKNMTTKCGHRQLFGDFVAPEQLWPYENEPFIDSKLPGYDEKVDIWKVPNILQFLLGKSNQAVQIKFRLFEIMRRCKSLNPRLRPTAIEIKELLLIVIKDLNMKIEL